VERVQRALLGVRVGELVPAGGERKAGEVVLGGHGYLVVFWGKVGGGRGEFAGEDGVPPAEEYGSFDGLFQVPGVPWPAHPPELPQGLRADSLHLPPVALRRLEEKVMGKGGNVVPA
jgi:hypothetical protein